MRKLLAASLTAALVGACNLTDTHTRQQQLGLLRLAPEDSIDFVAPDTVALNTDFTISVTTYGGSCDTKGPTDVIPLADGSVEFRPFDITEVRAGTVCPLEVRSFAHTGTLKISSAGSTRITLRGRDWTLGVTTRTKTVVAK